MNETVYVNTGEVKLGGENIILNSGAIGSCVVVTMYNVLKKNGAMAHIMLPGIAPEGKEWNNTKYASNSIREMLGLMKNNNDKTNKIEACIIGGANVLKRTCDTIGENNITSVEKLIEELGIKIHAKAVGGFERRTAVFHVETGCIYFTVGDSKQKLLWKTGSLQ